VSATASPFREALAALARAGVDFVLVGVGGINFYARDPAEVVRTVDLDVLIPRRVDALRGALAALHAAGFRFEASGEPFVDVGDEAVLGRIVESGGNVAAVAGGVRLDLMLAATGFGFDELAADAERFRLGDLEVSVGRLEKLLRSKALAGRAKDREFLRLFAARLREDAERGR
jgi:predicted nucleotidyltransferase